MSVLERPLALDLFAGAGGLTEGLRRGGFRVAAAVEIDPLAAATYRKNHDDVILFERDIRRVPAAAVARTVGIKRGELDLLAGCPPCQGFSSMRTLNGGKRVIDSQNDLLFEFLRFARALRPKVVMLENVPALGRNRRMKEFCRSLKGIGYQGEFRVVDAADYGVPQRRRRLILLASRAGVPPFAAPSARRTTVRRAFHGLGPAGSSGDPLHDVPECRSALVRELIRAVPRNGGSRGDAPKRFLLDCHKRVDGFFDVYGRMAWDEVSPTITGGCHNPSKGRFLHPHEHRTITLREAALLQSFPRNYFFSLERGKELAALMIGNALPPRLITKFAKPLVHFIAGMN